MRILKKILTWLGAIFVLLIIAFTLLSLGSGDFKDAHSQFIAEFMTDLSRNWQSSDVQYRLTNEALAQITSAEGRRVMQQFSHYGEIQAINDIEIENYTSGTGGKFGTFTFKATFENTDAVVRISIIEKDDKVQVQGINISPTEVGIVNNSEDLQT